MRWRRRRQDSGLSIAEINLRLRGFLLDSQINNSHEISVILGCGFISEELMEKEEEESDKRVERISHLTALIHAHAQALSTGAVEYQRSELSEEFKDLPDEMWWESKKLLEQVAVASLLGSISQLVDMGLLEIPKRYR